MARIPVRFCAEADRDHRKSARAYAHVEHRSSTICIARAFARDLPDNFIYAILLHELGHLALWRDAKHTEKDADRAGSRIGGVQITRRTWDGRRNLEFVAPEDVPAARRAVRRLTTFRALQGLRSWTVR